MSDVNGTEERLAEAAVEQAEATPDERIGMLEEALAAKEQEARENWDRFLRERADLENFRKRASRENEELHNYGVKSLVEEVLPVVDNLERALDLANQDGLPALVEGVRMTHTLLMSALKSSSLRCEGARHPFDPAFHQAASQVPTDDYPANAIVQEFQKGYLLKDRLVRPAMVSYLLQIIFMLPVFFGGSA